MGRPLTTFNEIIAKRGRAKNLISMAAFVFCAPRENSSYGDLGYSASPKFLAWNFIIANPFFS